MQFSRTEYWSGWPFPSPGDLPNPGIEPSLPYCKWILYQLIWLNLLTWIHLEINVLVQVADKWLYNSLGWLTENNKNCYILFFFPFFLVAQSCPTLCDPMDCSPPGSSVHGDSPGKNTGVGCHSLLQGIFTSQEMNLGLQHCRQILYYRNCWGS